MFHNWLEVQVYAIDRQRELLQAAKESRVRAATRKQPAQGLIAGEVHGEEAFTAWRRAG